MALQRISSPDLKRDFIKVLYRKPKGGGSHQISFHRRVFFKKFQRNFKKSILCDESYLPPKATV